MGNMRVVILAKSYKPGGRCLAGRFCEFTGPNRVNIGKWMRPVPNGVDKSKALSEEMYTYEDGTEVKILDIVDIPVIGAWPLDGQPENYVIDESIKWKKVGSMSASSIPGLIENIDSIWLDPTVESNIVTAHYDSIGLVNQSLCLIKPFNLNVTLSKVYDNEKGTYKKKIFASFDYNNVRYENISITCPATRKILTNKYPNDGDAPKTMKLNKGDNYILCMSLAPRFGSLAHHYKLVATVFDFDGYLQRTYAA